MAGLYFVSHAAGDLEWAEWVGYRLDAAGYKAELSPNNWTSRADFLRHIEAASEGAEVEVVALFSEAYFGSRRPMMELRAWVARPDGAKRLIPLRIEEVEPPRLYRTLNYTDLFDLPAVTAREVLLVAIEDHGRPVGEPSLPGPGRSGARPTARRARRLPGQNKSFTGRADLLDEVHDQLASGDRTVVQALNGLAGVGKTQLATEYGYRYADEYDIAWWIDAEQHELIAEQLAALATMADLTPPDTPAPRAVDALFDYLRQRERWLLVFDNANEPEEIEEWLPEGPGHVIITSRHEDWSGIATPVDVSTFGRDESIQLLRRQAKKPTARDANLLAEDLGDLPLAIAQAAAVLAETKMSVSDYRALLARNPRETTGFGRARNYPVSFAASLDISLGRLASLNPAALDMIRVCALLAPEPVPLDLFAEAPAEALPPALAEVARRPTGVYRCVGPLVNLGLLRSEPEGLVLHRLTLLVIADGLDDDVRPAIRRCAEAVVAAADPGAGDTQRRWRRWRQLMPHLLALEPGRSNNPALRRMANNGVAHLLSRRDAASSRPLAGSLYHDMTDKLGPEHPDTLTAAENYASCLADLDEYEQALRLDQQTLATREQTLGPDHRDTLVAASNVAVTLQTMGRSAEARELNEQTLARQRELLGWDHPDTFVSANNLALNLRARGDIEGSRRLNEATLADRRRVLGAGHPATLITASNLAADLYWLGRLGEARSLYEEVLETRRRVLGKDHPDTLESIESLDRVRLALDGHAS